MTEDFVVRPAGIDDMMPAYAVFRRSLFDYLFRIALVEESVARNPPIDSAWERQGLWTRHLWTSAAENWIAADRDGKVIGWAMSIERDDHLELTHFFVEPGIQGKGIGRDLLSRAFPEGRARHKSIVATQDARALALYLRSGVGYVATSVDLLVTPQRLDTTSDLDFELLGAGDAAIATVSDLEREVLGFSRPGDIAFLLRMRPCWLARRDGRPAGYAFGVQPNPAGSSDHPPVCGPMAARDPADMPALLDQVIATAGGEQDFSMLVPLSNRIAVTHALARGARIDPFYVTILASDDAMQLDRYIHTSPAFIL